MIVTVDDFNLGVTNIPDCEDVELSTSEEVEAYISEWEPILLKHLLGYDLATNLALYADLAIPAPNPIYDNIIDGKVFGTGGDKDRYDGIKKAIIYFVFFKYLSHTQTKLTSSGEIVPKTENSEQISSAHRLCIVYNLMTDSNIDLIAMLNENLSLYPTWDEYSETQKGYDRISNLITKINPYGI